ncbi:hypothetical protein KBC51_02035 [Candidatus Saccharibacteria bacterium]|jgi:hypothetical protein|nr:hypothetical protein [Candidatus Saccharibacteria bacterium]MCA9350594.1 hypothetical protein [Candidatus Saccharibacteria bacterium]
MKKLIKKIFYNDQGKLVIAQFPNLPIMLAFLFIVLGWINVFNSSTQLVFSNLATSFLVVWAYLEITSGVNYFRRALGVAVLIYIIVGWL